MSGDSVPVRAQLRDLGCILRDVRGQLARARLVARLVGSRAGRPGGRIRIPFRLFEADFELSQGEIAPYAQMVRDIDDGVIPSGPQIRGWTVVDCGANVGLFSLFLREAERVVAVEPNPDVNQRLTSNLALNDVPATVVEAAISDQNGTVKMDFENALSVLSEIGDSGAEVRSVSLDGLLTETGVDTVDLLKLDVEGHEIEALRGGSEMLSKGRVKRIVAEFQSDDALSKLDEHLGDLGFKRVATGRFNARFEL